MRSIRITTTLALIAAVGLSACSDGEVPERAGPVTPTSAGTAEAALVPQTMVGTWIAVRATGQDVSAQHQVEPFLRLAADGTWTGSDGCNSLVGTASVQGTAASFTLGPAHLAGCHNVVPDFTAVRSIAVTEQTLTLFGADRSVVAEYRRQG